MFVELKQENNLPLLVGVLSIRSVTCLSPPACETHCEITVGDKRHVVKNSYESVREAILEAMDSNNGQLVKAL